MPLFSWVRHPIELSTYKNRKPNVLVDRELYTVNRGTVVFALVVFALFHVSLQENGMADRWHTIKMSIYKKLGMLLSKQKKDITILRHYCKCWCTWLQLSTRGNYTSLENYWYWLWNTTRCHIWLLSLWYDNFKCCLLSRLSCPKCRFRDIRLLYIGRKDAQIMENNCSCLI